MLEAGINPFYTLKSIDLLIKREELDSKLDACMKLRNADNIINSLLTFKEQLDEEIERRMYSNEINDEVIFVFEDYMKRKHDIENEALEQSEQVKMAAHFGDINEVELALKLEDIEKNKKEGLNRLAETIK